METMKIYKVEETNFNNEGDIVSRVQDLAYTSLQKAIRHLKNMAVLYKGSFNQEEDKVFSYTHYKDKDGCSHILSIDTMLVF